MSEHNGPTRPDNGEDASMDALRRELEALRSRVDQADTGPKSRSGFRRLNPFTGWAEQRRQNKAYYENQKAAAPTDSASNLSWVAFVLVVGFALWAVSSWWLNTTTPTAAPEPATSTTAEPVPSSAASQSPSGGGRATAVPTETVDGFVPQAVPENTVATVAPAPLPAPMVPVGDPTNAEAVITNLAITWLSRTGGGDAWQAAAEPWSADGLAEQLDDAPMVRSALSDAGDTSVQSVELSPDPESTDTPTRTTRRANVTIARTTGAPLILQLGLTAYNDGAAWRVGIVEEFSYTGGAS